VLEGSVAEARAHLPQADLVVVAGRCQDVAWHDCVIFNDLKVKATGGQSRTSPAATWNGERKLSASPKSSPRLSWRSLSSSLVLFDIEILFKCSRRINWGSRGGLEVRVVKRFEVLVHSSQILLVASLRAFHASSRRESLPKKSNIVLMGPPGGGAHLGL